MSPGTYPSVSAAAGMARRLSRRVAVRRPPARDAARFLGVSLLVAVLGSPGADPAAAFTPGWILVALAALAGGLSAFALPGPADGQVRPAHGAPGGRLVHTRATGEPLDDA